MVERPLLGLDLPTYERAQDTRVVLVRTLLLSPVGLSGLLGEECRFASRVNHASGYNHAMFITT